MTSILFGSIYAALLGIVSHVFMGAEWSIPEAAIFGVVCIIFWELLEQGR